MMEMYEVVDYGLARLAARLGYHRFQGLASQLVGFVGLALPHPALACRERLIPRMNVVAHVLR